MNWRLWSSNKPTATEAYIKAVKDLGRYEDNTVRRLLPMQRCSTCRWFRDPPYQKPSVEDLALSRVFFMVVATCRRHAPISVDTTGRSELGWPIAQPYDYCGDWEQA